MSLPSRFGGNVSLLRQAAPAATQTPVGKDSGVWVIPAGMRTSLSRPWEEALLRTAALQDPWLSVPICLMLLEKQRRDGYSLRAPAVLPGCPKHAGSPMHAGSPEGRLGKTLCLWTLPEIHQDEGHSLLFALK